jgi:hypothetical protein
VPSARCVDCCVCPWMVGRRRWFGLVRCAARGNSLYGGRGLGRVGRTGARESGRNGIRWWSTRAHTFWAWGHLGAGGA